MKRIHVVNGTVTNVEMIDEDTPTYEGSDTVYDVADTHYVGIGMLLQGTSPLTFTVPEQLAVI